jgi:hypothetical protein
MSIDPMPKRFTIGPLGFHDDQWLNAWSWLTGRTKASQATLLLSFRVRERKSLIEEMLGFTADKLGITPDELFDAIQNGTADQLIEAYEGRIDPRPQAKAEEDL